MEISSFIFLLYEKWKKKKKKKKNTLWKNFLYFAKWNFLAPSLKNLLNFRKELKSLKIKKKSYTFPYKEAKCSKLKYFLIITIKLFFSFYNIFSILNKLLLFIFWEVFVMLTNILSYCPYFFFFFLRKILISIYI